MRAIVSANRAIVVMLVDKPVFDALLAVLVLAGTSDLPNLQRVTGAQKKYLLLLESMSTARTVSKLLNDSMHIAQTSSPASQRATGAHWSNTLFLRSVSLSISRF
jgi:hypothetical protein